MTNIARVNKRINRRIFGGRVVNGLMVWLRPKSIVLVDDMGQVLVDSTNTALNYIPGE